MPEEEQKGKKKKRNTLEPSPQPQPQPLSPIPLRARDARLEEPPLVCLDRSVQVDRRSRRRLGPLRSPNQRRGPWALNPSSDNNASAGAAGGSCACACAGAARAAWPGGGNGRGHLPPASSRPVQRGGIPLRRRPRPLLLLLLLLRRPGGGGGRATGGGAHARATAAAACATDGVVPGRGVGVRGAWGPAPLTGSSLGGVGGSRGSLRSRVAGGGRRGFVFGGWGRRGELARGRGCEKGDGRKEQRATGGGGQRTSPAE